MLFCFLSQAHANQTPEFRIMRNNLYQDLRQIGGPSWHNGLFCTPDSVSLAAPWPQETREALQSSDVMMFLISPDSLQSPHCGKELAFFLRRMELSESISVGGLLLVWWTRAGRSSERMLPTDAPELPARLRRYQFSSETLPDSYHRYGLYGLKRRGMKMQFNHVLIELASALVKASLNWRIPRFDDPLDLETLPSLFDEVDDDAGEAVLGSSPFELAPEQLQEALRGKEA
jgi:hypothetical protein